VRPAAHIQKGANPEAVCQKYAMNCLAALLTGICSL
jgi:hypothetical protein